MTRYSIAYKVMLFLLLAVTGIRAYAQDERKLVREGNKLFREKKYSDAEVSYKKSLNLNKQSHYGQFNLGDAYYRQEKYEDAVKQFTGLAADKKLDKQSRSQAYHNIGNSWLEQKKYEESITAYKNALKLNPADNDTRYNLAYAQSMLRKEQQQQQQKSKDQKDDKDKKDDKGNKDENKDNKGDDQKDNKDKKDGDDKKQGQAKPQKISKEDAEKILQALNNDEKNIQKKLPKKDAKRVNIEKNW